MLDISEEILHTEFSHVRGVTYLDHAGAALYSSKQLQDHMEDLTSNLYSNPHSGSPSSHRTTSSIDATRELVLKHFNTDSNHFDVVFTSSCTAALSLLSRAFPWQGVTLDETKKMSLFYYLDDNHTSVVGMREVAGRNGAKTLCVSSSDLKINTNEPHPPGGEMNGKLSVPRPPEPHPPFSSGPYHLFAYPAQSNFSGHKYPLTWCRDIPSRQLFLPGCESYSGEWTVLLDAASHVSTSPLDLTSHRPHFLTLSFYKMFGFPTGLGALLVRKDCGNLLNKLYYGGGTVKATDSWTFFHVLKDQLQDRLEDGTLPFLEILALRHGFATLSRLRTSMTVVQQHTFSLARKLYISMSELKHSNGNKVCLLYCDTDFEGEEKQGPIINFNLLRSDGQVVGYSQVDKLASVFDIHLRTGCFCNTGACMRMLGINSERLKRHLDQGHVCGDQLDIIDGNPTGSIRISFGYTSTERDIVRFLDFIEECFIDKNSSPLLSESNKIQTSVSVATGLDDDEGVHSEVVDGTSFFHPSTTIISCGDLLHTTSNLSESSPSTLHSITLYPIKSCAGFKVKRWPVGEKGLLLDREWMVVGESGSLLSQKQEPRLCLVQPSINLKRQTMTLSTKGHPSVYLEIGSVFGAYRQHPLANNHQTLLTRVCRDRVEGIDCGDGVAEWLTRVLGRKSRLVQQNPLYDRKSKGDLHGAIPGENLPPLLSLANEAQYLLLSLSSLRALLKVLRQNHQEWVGLGVSDLATRFRANFVVERQGMQPYEEELWEKVRVGHHVFQVIGKCRRCQMVCVDPNTGGKTPELFKTLLTLRGNKASFGIYLCQQRTENHLTI